MFSSRKSVPHLAIQKVVVFINTCIAVTLWEELFNKLDFRFVLIEVALTGTTAVICNSHRTVPFKGLTETTAAIASYTVQCHSWGSDKKQQHWFASHAVQCHSTRLY